MATTTLLFEAEIINDPPSERGLMAGAAYKLRMLYRDGMVDPAAHTSAKGHAKQQAMMNNKNKMTSFDAITGP